MRGRNVIKKNQSRWVEGSAKTLLIQLFRSTKCLSSVEINSLWFILRVSLSVAPRVVIGLEIA